MKKIALAVAVALGALSQPVALAGTQTGTMPVSITLTGTCSSVIASPLNFGTMPNDQGASGVNADATITLNCSHGTDYTVDIDNGTNAYSDGTRALANTIGFFNYFLYKDAARTQVWGSSTPSGSTLSATASSFGLPITHTVYGHTFFSNGFTGGTYTDSVTITVTY